MMKEIRPQSQKIWFSSPMAQGVEKMVNSAYRREQQLLDAKASYPGPGKMTRDTCASFKNE